MSGRRRKDFPSLLNGRVKQTCRSLNISRVTMRVGQVFTMRVPLTNGAPIATLVSSDPTLLGIAHLGGGRYVLTALAGALTVACHMLRNDFGAGQFGVTTYVQIIP